MNKSSVIKGVGCLAVLLLVFQFLVLIPIGKFVDERRLWADRTRLRGIAQALHTYANNNDQTYPKGFGEMVYGGYIAPVALISYQEHENKTDALALTDIGDVAYTIPYDPVYGEIMSRHTAFHVLVWEKQAPLPGDTVMAYRRPLKHRDEIEMITFDLDIQTLSRDEAARLIREAGHEPAWED